MANANNNNAQQQIVVAAPPLTPLRYPSKDFNCLERWIRHFEAMAQANNWDDARQRAVLPTCLNNYALDEYYNLPNQYLIQVQGQPAPTIERVLNALNNRIGDFPNARSARTEFKNLQQNEGESIQEFSRRVRKLGEAANAHLNATGRQEANKDAFIDGLLDSEIRYTLLKEDPDTFNASAQRAIALEAIAKVENARYRPRRTGHVRWTQGDDDESGRKTEIRDLSTNVGMGLSDLMENQIRSFNKLLEQQERHTQIMERILVTQSRFLTEFAPAQRTSRSPARVDRNSNVQCYHCQDWGHFASRCPKRSTASRRQEDGSAETQPVVKMILQRAQRHETFNSASIENNSGIFGPTVYVDAKLNGKLHRALLDTGSKVNIISEQTYKLYSPPMLLSDFHDTVLSATNDPFRILGKFTGVLAFGPGMVIQTEFLVTPDTDVPLILGTPILQENQMSIDSQSRQLMMGTESSTVNLTFLWKTEKPGQVKVCGAESELQGRETLQTEKNYPLEPTSEDELNVICNLVKSDSSDHGTGLKTLNTVACFRDVFALNDAELGQTQLVEHDIDTGDAGPIKLAP